MEGAERDLRRVEEPAAFLGGNGADEYAVGRAGDEVADVFVTGKRGHGDAVGRARVLGRKVSVAALLVFPIAIVHRGFEGAPPGVAATLEGLGAGGIEARGGRAEERRDGGGFDQTEHCVDYFGHGGFSIDSVRRARVILCNGQACPRFAAPALRPVYGRWAGDMPTWRSSCTRAKSLIHCKLARKSLCRWSENRESRPGSRPILSKTTRRKLALLEHFSLLV